MLMLATVLAIHGAALATVLVLSRTSAVLVDEQGHPLDRDTAWHERVIPAVQPGKRLVR